jgi:hypothetical protein
MKRPLIAVLVGGAAKPFRFDAAVTADLVSAAQRQAERQGGSLYFTTSRRTPEAAAEKIEQLLPAGAALFRWRPDIGGDNPYLGLLASADSFIVTGDSPSMLMEVARLGRPLAIFVQPVEMGWRERLVDWAGGKLLHDLTGLAYPRDLTRLHDALIRRGMAARLGAAPSMAVAALPDELGVVAARIQSLLDGDPLPRRKSG